MKHNLIDDQARIAATKMWIDRQMNTPSQNECFHAGWDAALKAAAKLAYSVNNHDDHMQWVIPTGPNSDRCGWCACLETIAGLLDPDDYKGSDTPGIHDNEKGETE